MDQTANKPPLSIAVIGCVGIPPCYGGFETLVEYLVEHHGPGHEMHVYCSAPRYAERPAVYKGAHLHYVPLDANGIASVAYDGWSLFHAARYADVMLILGVSGCMFLPLIRLVSRARIVVNVDGIEWRREKWSRPARSFLRFSESMAVRHAHEIVCDNRAIKEYFDAAYGIDAHFIAYGGDHARHVAYDERERAQYPFLGREFAVKVCRLEPENNLHVVLEAFTRHGGMPLVIIGNWEANDYARELAAEYADAEGVYLLDPIFDQDRLNAIRSNAVLYLHGHSKGGTNPSLVEAMWLGLAVFTFDVPYNRASTGGHAEYFSDADGLVALLAGLDETKRRRNAEAMKRFAGENYRWSEISRQYFDLLADPG